MKTPNPQGSERARRTLSAVTLPRRNVVSRFVTDRYTYREQPNYLPELVAFAVLSAAAGWPMALAIHVLAHGN